MLDVFNMSFKSITCKSNIYSLCLQKLHYSTSSSDSTVLIDKVGPITTIGINRPNKRNCVDRQTAILIHKAIESFENDTDALAGVLYGVGGSFCSGYDLSELAKARDTLLNNKATMFGTMGPTLRYIEKPLVAAVSGFAVAGGLELALMCDLRVVEDTAIMGVYNRRFGVPLIDGGTVRLQALIGLSRALDMILTGRSVDAKEALEWGLANRIVACGTALGQAVQLASSLVKFPQKCLLKDRRLTYNAAYNTAYQELLKLESQDNEDILMSEAITGAKKFLSGIGRHGKSYNLKEKERKHWEDDS